MSILNTSPISDRIERHGRTPRRVPAPAAARTAGVATTLGFGLAGALLLWAAFPPLGLSLLAWIAPVPWLLLVCWPRLPGRRPYLVLWAAGLVHWLLMLEGIRLAHPALYAGWVALAAYLGVYLPLFVGLARVAVRRLAWPLAFAAPVVWVGLEFLRGHLITGFSLALLAHTQAEWPILIQISDLGGGYTLSFLLMLVAAAIAQATARPVLGRFATPAPPADVPAGNDRLKGTTVYLPTGRQVTGSLAAAASGLALTLGYGGWRLSQPIPGASGPAVHAALIQGSLDTVFELTEARLQETWDHYSELTREATRQRANLDLIVWPESMFVVPERLIEEPLAAGSNGLPAETLRANLQSAQREFAAIAASQAALANAHTSPDHPGTALVVGTNTFVYGTGEPRSYNAALLLDREGRVAARYYKTHPVMFGEYIPLADRLPWLYRLTPLPGGLSAGEGPVRFEVGGLALSPSVCFESTIPHLIRKQLLELTRRGEPADALINVTNDGWFWGSAVLDLHLRCGVFRAVENRKPFVVAANTGISAWIDGNGVIRGRGLRRQPQVLLAAIHSDGRASPYHRLGDWPAGACAVVCVVLVAASKMRNEG